MLYAFIHHGRQHTWAAGVVMHVEPMPTLIVLVAIIRRIPVMMVMVGMLVVAVVRVPVLTVLMHMNEHA